MQSWQVEAPISSSTTLFTSADCMDCTQKFRGRSGVNGGHWWTHFQQWPAGLWMLPPYCVVEVVSAKLTDGGVDCITLRLPGPPCRRSNGKLNSSCGHWEKNSQGEMKWTVEYNTSICIYTYSVYIYIYKYIYMLLLLFLFFSLHCTHTEYVDMPWGCVMS